MDLNKSDQQSHDQTHDVRDKRNLQSDRKILHKLRYICEYQFPIENICHFINSSYVFIICC